MNAIHLNTLDELYVCVESTLPRTGLILRHDALYCPWARAVVAGAPEVRWQYPNCPLSQQIMQHLSNFAHSALIEKGFVLLESGTSDKGH
jgi:hypothetical protein